MRVPLPILLLAGRSRSRSCPSPVEQKTFATQSSAHRDMSKQAQEQIVEFANTSVLSRNLTPGFETAFRPKD